MREKRSEKRVGLLLFPSLGFLGSSFPILIFLRADSRYSRTGFAIKMGRE